ncbi:hypothetical protein B0H15DRAFT_237739 [Mycena belliarum]|uniref:DUF6534 domain-containing protein n=1 Tax=Mycena belliarum TaxID=1033014 RepID=A0AAD6XQ87_9AGAR|nr:hypothetical protein B0H15DRAFT_237739 [Mycena belliae]
MTSQYQFAPGPLTIPLFVGTVINWALFGVLVVQVCLYFAAFRKDPRHTKFLVAAVFAAEVLQTLGCTHDTLHSFGDGWGDPAALDDVGWAWFSIPVLGSAIASAGQMFFAWRIYIISHRRLIPTIIALVTAFQFGAGIWSGTLVANARKFSLLQYRFFKTPVAWLASTALADSIIVGATVYYLLKLRQPGFNRSTDALLFRIIKVTAATGVVCAVFATLNLALFVKYPGNNYHLAVCIWLTKLYSNSILLILNARASIWHATSTAVASSTGSATDLEFQRSGMATPDVTGTAASLVLSDGGEKIYAV